MSALRRDRSAWFIAGLASCASIAALVYFYRHDELLLYGDAVAHLNIARRVFDSQTPGPAQLGTVWLPLPHILILPFIVSDWLWRTGVGAAIPAMAAYVSGSVGVFRLLRLRAPGYAAWVGTILFASNVNLLYMQATAMTEPLSLAFSLWAILYFAEFAETLHPRAEAVVHSGVWREQIVEAAAAAKSGGRSLGKCALCLAATMLTRYDGWFLAALIFIAVLAISAKPFFRRSEQRTALRRALRNFVLLTAAAPVFWLSYNFGVYENAFEFINGPYSARAIAERSSQQGEPRHPGYHNLKVAGRYFLKAAQLNQGGAQAWQKGLMIAGLLGLVFTLLGGHSPHLWLLCAPLPFYVLSIAYGGVPIFMPQWWPYSFYNVRYGLQMLPAVAVLTAVFFHFITGRLRTPLRLLLLVAALAAIVWNDFLAWKMTPICLQEARVNSTTRIALESKLAAELAAFPRNATFTMYTADHVGAWQRAGVHLRRVTNESNDHLWQAALARPAESADYVIALRGDPVWQAVAQHPQNLEAVVRIESRGQPPAVLYRSKSRVAR